MASPAPMTLPVTTPDGGVVSQLDEPAETSLPAGTRLGAYRLGRVVGRGGMGAVYEGEHLSVGKRVAIKTLLPHLAASPTATQRFLREAKAAGRVRHPHTVDVTDVGVAAGVPFIVMELLEGENLLERLGRTGPMRAEVVVDLMLPVCSALATAHAEGVVHRDLKPENVFVSRTRTGAEVVKVLDFGISSLAHDQGAIRLTATNSVIGTPRYMSPEQTKGAKLADARSDQWSVGVMMYQCLTGTLPYDGESFIEILQKLANTKAPPPSKCVRGIPAALDAAIMRTLSKDPKQRFPSMTALARALLPLASPQVRAVWEPAFADGAPTPADVRPVLSGDSTLRVERPEAGSPAWRLVVAWCAAAGLLLALVALGVWLVFGAPARPPVPVVTPLPPATSAIDPSPTIPAPPAVPLPPAGETAPPSEAAPATSVLPSDPARPPEAEVLGEPRPSQSAPPSVPVQTTGRPPPHRDPAQPREPHTPTHGVDPVGRPPGPPPTSLPESRPTPEARGDEPRVGPNGAAILR